MTTKVRRISRGSSSVAEGGRSPSSPPARYRCSRGEADGGEGDRLNAQGKLQLGGPCGESGSKLVR